MTDKQKIIEKLVEISIECGKKNEQIETYVHESDGKGNVTECSRKHYQRMHDYRNKLYHQIEILKEVLND